jgi:hypothetical protein
MCDCCINAYYTVLYSIFGIPSRIDEPNENENYKAFLPKSNGSFTEVDLDNTNPLYMKR